MDQFVHFVRGIKTNHKLKVKVKVANLADLLNEVDKEYFAILGDDGWTGATGTNESTVYGSRGC